MGELTCKHTPKVIVQDESTGEEQSKVSSLPLHKPFLLLGTYFALSVSAPSPSPLGKLLFIIEIPFNQHPERPTLLFKHSIQIISVTLTTLRFNFLFTGQSGLTRDKVLQGREHVLLLSAFLAHNTMSGLD